MGVRDPVVVEEAVVVAAAAEDCKRGGEAAEVGAKGRQKEGRDGRSKSALPQTAHPTLQERKRERTLVVVGATQAEEVAAAAVDEV